MAIMKPTGDVVLAVPKVISLSCLDDSAKLRVLSDPLSPKMQFLMAVGAQRRDIHRVVRTSIRQSIDVVNFEILGLVWLFKGSLAFTVFAFVPRPIERVGHDDRTPSEYGCCSAPTSWVFVCSLVCKLSEIRIIAEFLYRLIEDRLPIHFMPSQVENHLAIPKRIFLIEYPFTTIHINLALLDEQLQGVATFDVVSDHVVVVGIRITVSRCLAIKSEPAIGHERISVAVTTNLGGIADQDNDVVFSASVDAPSIMAIEIRANSHSAQIGRSNFNTQHKLPPMRLVAMVLQLVGCIAVKEHG